MDVVGRLEHLESVRFQFSNGLFEFGRANYGYIYSEKVQEPVEEEGEESEDGSEDGSEEQRT
ncbi:hypothetical protein BGX23_011760, partial [Mortierella sp. AD031]